MGFLIGLSLLYLALLPWLRRMGAETARLQQLNASREVEMARLADQRRALDQARTRVERSPGDPRVRLELAARLSDAGQQDEAVQHARIAARLEPHDPEPLLLLADLEHRARQYDAAVDAYRAALAINPGNQRALTGLTFLYISFGWPRDAEALLQPAVRAAPENPYLKVALAAAYTQLEDWNAAERLLLEARRLAPKEATLWSPLAHLYNQTHRAREAIAVSREALVQRPGNTEVLNELGRAYYHLRDLPTATATYQQVITLQPNSLVAHYSLALCWQRSGQLAKAIHELESVFRRDHDYAGTRLLLGRLYLRAGRAVEGRKLLDEYRRAQPREHERSRAGLLVATHPDSAEAHWRMALLYQAQGDRPHMRVEACKTLELNPRHPGAHRVLQER